MRINNINRFRSHRGGDTHEYNGVGRRAFGLARSRARLDDTVSDDEKRSE